MLQTYNVFANMDLLKAAGIKAPTVDEPVDVGPLPRRAKQLTKDGNYGVCWGLRSPTAADPDDVAQLRRPVHLPRERQVELKFGAEREDTLTDDPRHDLRRQVGRPGRHGPLRHAAAARFFGGKCAMTVQGNFQAQG